MEKSTFKRGLQLLSYGRSYGWAVVGVVISVLLSTAFALLPPWLVRYGIDKLIIDEQPDLLWLLGLALIGVTLLKGAVDFAKRYSAEYIAQRIIHDIRSQLYDHLNQLSFSFYDSARTGDIMSRVTADTDILRKFLSKVSIYVSGNILTIVGILAVMVFWNFQLAILYLMMVPLMVYGMIKYSTRVRPMFRRVRRKFSNLTEIIQEDLNGIESIKLFGREEEERQDFIQENQDYVNTKIEAAQASALWMPYVNFLVGLGSSLVIWYGGRLVISGEISFGMLAGFISYIALLFRPVRQTGMMINFTTQAAAAAERIFDVLQMEPEVQEADDAYKLPEVEGRVEYRDVSFSYKQNEEILSGINLTAKPGQLIAIVGPSGAGKSTLLHLLPRFYDPDQGEILIDDHNIREVTIDSLRSQIGIVLQNTYLFAASIKENISYGRPEAPMEEIIEAAQIAQVHDFIQSLSLGYETPVGEEGVNLSGGQKQRLAMARVLLTDPKLLLLDEPTSSLDAETEEEMQQALSEVIKGRTTFIIAHRLWTVERADQILVIDSGKIVERGSHEELVSAGGLYSQLYSRGLSDKLISETAGETDARRV